MADKHAANITITATLIEAALALPEGSIIYDIRRHPDYFDQFIFTVLHEDLPAVTEGNRLPYVSPTIRLIEGATPCDWLAFDWGDLHDK